MTPEIQTYLALAVVALTATGLVWKMLRKDHSKGCGGGECGALSPEVKKLRARIKH
ncbi:MAG: hypothetical protein KA257_05740 [Opitutaceae bacterium]|nr:hypothetical protein [Opitutaceae bacterium]MBP9913455.1 hypothetical protein [Opitutaceae bacterium]